MRCKGSTADAGSAAASVRSCVTYQFMLTEGGGITELEKKGGKVKGNYLKSVRLRVTYKVI